MSQENRIIHAAEEDYFSLRWQQWGNEAIWQVIFCEDTAKLLGTQRAGVAELADAQDLKVRDANIPNRFRFIRKPFYLPSALRLIV